MSDWVIVGQWATKSTRSNWYGHTYRQVIQAEVVPVSGSKIRLTFKSSANGVLDILNCFVGLCEGSDPAGAEFKEEPTRVTFSSADGVSVSGSVVSDEIDFAYDPQDGDALMVSFAVSSQRFHANLAGNKNVEDVTVHYIQGDHAGDMPGELGGDIFRFDPEFSVLSVARVELLSDDVPSGPVTINLKSDFVVESDDKEWATIYTWEDNTTSTNWRGYTTRWRVDDSALQAGKKFRLVAKGHPTQSTTVTQVVMAEGATNGNSEHGYKYAPIPVTWNGGSSGFTIGPGVELISDIIELVYDPATGCPLVIGTWIDPSVPNNQDDVIANNTDGRAILYYKTGNDLTNLTPTGYSVATADDWLYIRIEAILDDLDEVKVSKLSGYWLTGVLNAVRVSKFAGYWITGELDAVRVSKLSIYALISNEFERSVIFDYAILSDSISSMLTSDYRILSGDVQASAVFDYSILGVFESEASFDYRIIGPFETEAVFDYRVLGNSFDVVGTFDYRVLEYIENSVSFDYGIRESTDLVSITSFGYAIEDQPLIDLPAIELYPLEPVREGWAWKTLVNISHTGKEQRIALRQRPRIMISYSVGLPDEALRIAAYDQLYHSIGKTPKIPFFQYATGLTEPLVAGETDLKFDPDKTYIQSNTPICLYRPRTRQYLFTQVLSMTPTGAILEEPLDFSLESDWEVMPVYYMRLPNLTSINMEALTGEYTLSGEQAYRRRFIRLESSAVVPTFEGKPLLAIRPIAVNSVQEQFDSNAEVLDNDTGLPKPYSSYENPFIDGSLEWLIDRETDMDFWRALLDSLRGQQSTFFMPTWREDLTPVENSLSSVIIEELDYADKFTHDTYRYLQFEMASGVYHRTVLGVSPVVGGLRLDLSTDIPDEAIGTISFLNRVRLNEDVVYLDHYRHHSTISLPIRTVNE